MRGGTVRTLARRWQARALALACLGLVATAPFAAAPGAPPLVTLSIVGTTDLHGAALPRNGLPGLPLFGGYVNNLRLARAADGGAVLLVDSGDTFQGDPDSNLSEGALVVDAYNALGYAAHAIGNHDFDFGAVDSPGARQMPGDPRGALKARAAQARYPFLAANLIDEATGRPVAWPNVRRSILLDAAGVKVGIVGVMTIDALRSTLAANVGGLRVAPVGPAIAEAAAALRASGASVVIVAAHAGGRCERFDRPADLSSCEPESEIFQIARSLPRGLVDVIAAGHSHAAVAHEVDGIAVMQGLPRGQAFGRVDLSVDRVAGRVVGARLFPPVQICARRDAAAGTCARNEGSRVTAEYEGRPVTPDAVVAAAMAPALAHVQTMRATALGLSLDAPVSRAGDGGSPLGTLFAEALRQAIPAADAAVVSNAARGLRADLLPGPLTLGGLYDVFPFDNRVARIRVTGAALERWIAGEIQQARRDVLGLAGLVAHATCPATGLRIVLSRADGRAVREDESLLVATIGAPTLSGGLAQAANPGGVAVAEDAPVVRELVEAWVRRLGEMPPAQRGTLARSRVSSAFATATDCAGQ